MPRLGVRLFKVPSSARRARDEEGVTMCTVPSVVFGPPQIVE